MDTEALAESNPAFNVAVLHETFLGEFEPNYHEEYLVHGIVQGPSYMAVPFHQLCSAGLLKYLPSITKSRNPTNEGGLTRLLPQNLKHSKADDLSKLMGIARSYGKDFTVPFAIVLFCCRKHPKLWSTITASGLQRMVDILGGRTKVLEAWGNSYSILYDGTYPKGYEANKQMIRVMRALTHFCWGQEAGHNAVSRHLVPATSVSAFDEERITSGMSFVHVSPAPSKQQRGFATGLSSGIPQKSRKRPRAESISQSYAISMNEVPDAYRIPLSKISSPYIEDDDYHKSGMRNASSAVRSLWLQVQLSSPIVLSFYTERDKIAMVSANEDENLCFESHPTDDMAPTNIGPIEFACCKDGEVLWFARVPADFPLKINGQSFGMHRRFVVGPLPLFSVWESEKGVAFVYVEDSALEYKVVPDHEHDGGRVFKRQKR